MIRDKSISIWDIFWEVDTRAGMNRMIQIPKKFKKLDDSLHESRNLSLIVSNFHATYHTIFESTDSLFVED